MRSFFDEKLAENEGENIVIVSYGDPIMILYANIMEIEIDLDVSLGVQLKEYVPKGGIIELSFSNKKLKESKPNFDYI